MKETSFFSNKKVFFTAAACILTLPQPASSFAPSTIAGTSRVQPIHGKQRTAIVLNNGSNEPPANEPTTILSNEDPLEPSIAVAGARLKADNIVIEKLVPGEDKVLFPIDDKMTIEEAVNADLTLSSSQVPAEIKPSSPDKSREDQSISYTSDILAGVDQEKLMDPSEVLNAVIGPDPSVVESDISSDGRSNSDNNDDHSPFTSDLLSGVDQAKLMDPTEVLNAVIGPAFSDISEDEIPNVPVDTTLLSTTDSIFHQPILETVTEITLPDMSLSESTSAFEISEPNVEEQIKENSLVTEDQSVDIPGVRDILRFAIPAIGVWLCSPLLSLIDTSAVGLLSGTTQQAALNPAVAVTDYSALLAAFMYTATTNLIAAAKERDSKVEGKPLSTSTLVTSLQLSGLVGGALGGVLIVFARTLLRGIIGNDAIDPAVFNAAMKYVRIRALGMPAAVIIGSAQSACLGLQDIRSPLYVLFAAAVVNFFGDCFFVGSSSSLFGGAAGAAWATVFSQYAALGMFMKWLTWNKAKKSQQDEKPMDLTKAILELTGESKRGKPRRRKFREALRSFKEESDHMKIPKAFQPISKLLKYRKSKTTDPVQAKKKVESTRGFLKGKFTPLDLLKIPSLEGAKQFWPYVIPVTTTSVGRVSSYVAMSYVVSSALGTVGMAAQQIIVSLFYCLTPVADSLNLTAQSFVPGIFEKEKSPARATALRKTTTNFLKSAGIFGVLLAATTTTIPLFTGFFTADPVVISQVNSVIPYLAGCFMLHGTITAGEGVLLGQKDLGFLGRLYAAFFIGVPYFMLRVKHLSQIGIKQASLTSVWRVFLGYQFVRTASFVMRLLQLQRRTERQIEI